MQTATNIRETITLRQEEEHERYQLDRLRTDEITQASEQLNGAMRNSFEYERGNDGNLYFQGQSLREVFEGGIKAAEEIVRQYPQFAVELQRRHIELMQYEAQVTLAAMPESDNQLVLVHVSPTPDVVLSGAVELNAYDRERKKIMVRVSEKTKNGLKVTSFSLDRNDRSGLQAIASFFGETIADDASSEDILEMNFLAEASQFGDQAPALVLRKLYDNILARRLRGKWYAGRQDSEVLHTIDMIERFPAIISEHVALVANVQSRYGRMFRETAEYEQANYNFLAAIQQANQLGEVVGSLGDAGDIAHSAGIEFALPDCPTGVAKTAAEALAKQGIEQWKPGQCRVCLESGMVGACEVCLACEIADNSGRDLDEIHRQALKRRNHQNQSQAKLDLAPSIKGLSQQSGYPAYYPKNSNSIARAKYGRYASLKPKIGIGTARLTVVNVLSGLDLQAAEQ